MVFYLGLGLNASIRTTIRAYDEGLLEPENFSTAKQQGVGNHFKTRNGRFKLVEPRFKFAAIEVFEFADLLFQGFYLDIGLPDGRAVAWGIHSRYARKAEIRSFIAPMDLPILFMVSLAALTCCCTFAQVESCLSLLMPIFSNFDSRLPLRFNVYSKIFDMSTLISVYLFIAISVVIFKAAIWFVKHVPLLVAYFLLAPVAPFYVARVNRKQRPALSRLLISLWLAFVLLSAATVAIGH